MLYKNISYSVKTFYGVEFKPGEVKEVPGYINNPTMIAVNSYPVQEASKPSKPSSEKSKKPSEKPVVIPAELSDDLPDEDKSDKTTSSKS